MTKEWHLERPSAYSLTFILDREALKYGWDNPVYEIADGIPHTKCLWKEGSVLPVTPEEEAELETKSLRYTLRLNLDCSFLPSSSSMADYIKAHFRMSEDKGYESIWRMESEEEEGHVFLWKAEVSADRFIPQEEALVIKRQLLEFDRKWFSHILGTWSVYADKPAVFRPFMKKPSNTDMAINAVHMAEALRAKDKREKYAALHNGWDENPLKTWFRLVYPQNAPWDWKKEENGQLLPSMLASCASATPLYWDGEFAYGIPLERKYEYAD